MKEVSQGVVQRDKAILAYPFDTVPSAGAALEVAPGVLWIRMPMPLALSHINVWAIDDGEGWAIVDTGLVTDATATAWYRLFADALDQCPVTRVFVTHMHPDHVGMAGWMTRMFACRLWMTRLEYLSCCNLAGNAGREVSEDAIRFYRRAGWSDATIKDYCVHFDDLSGSVYSIPDSFRRLRDGERILIGGCEWRIIVGSGHSPEHACLYSADLKLLISGDQVLPRISSNVSVYATEPDADPVSEWLASLVRLKDEVPDDVLVLPAHNEPFRRLHARLDELIESQLRSLDRLRESLREPKRVIDLFGVLFARNVDADLMLLSMATGETIACLNHLIARDEVIAQADHANVLWYRKR